MMSKMTEAVKNDKKDIKPVTNFMGGISYELNPLDSLKMVSASSIFGEPAYYRNGEFNEKKIMDGTFDVNPLFVEYSVLSMDKYHGMKTSELMEKIIDEALDYDYRAVLEWAKTLRKDYLMRLNPQVIMVRAAIHKNRKEFTEKNPGLFSEINMEVMQRADDVISQITYYIFKNGDKTKVPGILKRSWAKKIESMNRYELYKYRNAGIGLINSIRICHANNDNINELMETGTIDIPSNNTTWENLRATGMSWNEILKTIKMNHMALLRNLRGILGEVDDISVIDDVLELLKKGVDNGKQFPFRYMSARKAVNAAYRNNPPEKVSKTMDALDKCMDISCGNLPILKGNNAFLSDNSGSAWGTCTSEYGSVTIANIDNLSSVIGAANSEKGTVVKFGDKMKKYHINKDEGILAQTEKIDHGENVGMSTEGGIWKFFKEALDKAIVYDNIFIYSDMQAGHGELYGTSSDQKEYTSLGFNHGTYVDVAKLIKVYREKVNPKVNVYCIQTAGYNNVLVPENGYRCSILYGWTGKELVYADMMNKFWDEKDREQEG